MKCHYAALKRHQFTLRPLRYVPTLNLRVHYYFSPVMREQVPGGQAERSKRVRHGKATAVTRTIERATNDEFKKLRTILMPLK